MAYPSNPPKPRSSSPEEGTLLLTALLAFLAVGGLAKWAERSPTVLAALDKMTMPVVQAIAAHSPGFDHFLRQARPFTWYLIQSTIPVLILVAGIGLGLLLTADTRRRKRMAQRQRINERENEEIRKIKEAMDAKEQARRGEPEAGKKPKSGEATTDAERLKDVFRKQSPQE